ncbi:MAG: peptidylprolyl isomerase [Sedimentisphaerales bacterium]|nr:peptidylprolyl isomerase [Sedimentisphaerales bacterium]
MKKTRVVIQILTYLGIFSFILTFGCRKSKSQGGTDTNQPEPQTAVQVPADVNVAAVVNGVEITESRVQALIDDALSQFSNNTTQMPPAILEQYRKQIRPQALDQLVAECLLAEKVKQGNIVVSDEEVINALTQMLSSQPEPLTLEDYKQKLIENGKNFDEQKERIRKGLAYERVLGAQLEGKLNITEEDARKFYDENIKQFERGEQIRASHILIKPVYTQGGDPNEAKAVAKAKAQELLKKIKEGADFAMLAKANSNCPSAERGGDLGFFSKGDMTPPFEEAAFGLNLGQISDIVETEYGYHIIRVTDQRGAGAIPFDEVKDNLIQQLTTQRQNELTNAYIESLKAEAEIVYPADTGA